MSSLENQFAYHLQMMQLDPEWEREYRFHPERKWRLDFAWPHLKIGVEIQGGIYKGKGGHTSINGFQRDCDKLNAAQLLGWKIYKFTGQDVRSGRAFETMREALRDD